MAASKAQIEELLALFEQDPDTAARRAGDLVTEDCDDPLALFLLAGFFARAERYGISYHLFKRVTQMAPHNAEGWNNVGMALDNMGRHKAAREMYREALKRAPKNANILANMGVAYQKEDDQKNAGEWARRALAVDPNHADAWATLGFVALAEGDWQTGWKGYAHALGGKFRKKIQYGDEPNWDGTPGKTVVFYGEQGLGDEIMYASCLEDAARDVNVIVECDPRLEGLFRRSFPYASVYGTRRKKEVAWPAQHQLDASAPIGCLPMYYRPAPESCPRKPYLVADPERRIMWRALFDSWGKRPKVGICWSGGSKWTNHKERSVGLEAFRPLIESLDADFVSLQYRDPTDEIAASGLKVRHFRCTESPRAVDLLPTVDYDDTAAIVAELDVVIGIHTTAVHLAGALGVPAIALVPSKPLWLWSRDPIPFYGTVQTFRQKPGEEWAKTIERLCDSPDLDRFRPTGGGSLPCVQPVDHRDDERAGSDLPADAAGDPGLHESPGRNESVHHVALLHSSVAGLRRVGAVP